MNPWEKPEVAIGQRELTESQLTTWWKAGVTLHGKMPVQFMALCEAVSGTECPGDVLEMGCGSGYNREVLDRAGVEYRSYSGVDINETAIAMARERYPESVWICGEEIWRLAEGEKEATWARADIVIDGSCVLHIDDWKAHLARLCAASRRWVILHRVPISGLRGGSEETHRTETTGYGQTFPAWSFGASDIMAEMERHGFVATASRQADGDSRTMAFAKPRHFAAYADKNYLSRLKVLHASMVKHCGPFVLHVLAWDDEVLRWAQEAPSVEEIPVQTFINISHPDLKPEALPGPPRTAIEHMWTVGPQWVADVMAATGEPVTYVDADVCFYSSPEPVFAEIGGAAAGLVRHGFAHAAQCLPGPTIESHSSFGEFNVGVVHFGERWCAEEWARRCQEWCYDRLAVDAIGDVLYGDQKHLENMFSYRDGLRVVQHPCAALGPWAVHTRGLDVRDGVIHFGNRPLVAYHYSALRMPTREGEQIQLTRPEYQLTDRQADILYRPYIRALLEAEKTR